MNYCRRCNQYLLPEDFRRKLKHYTGVCKACEAKAAYERELREQKERQEKTFALARACRKQVLPDD